MVVRTERVPSRALKVTGFVLLGAATAALIGVVLARDQMVRHRRGLFSPHPLRRLAAPGCSTSGASAATTRLPPIFPPYRGG